MASAMAMHATASLWLARWETATGGRGQRETVRWWHQPHGSQADYGIRKQPKTPAFSRDVWTKDANDQSKGLRGVLFSSDSSSSSSSSSSTENKLNSGGDAFGSSLPGSLLCVVLAVLLLMSAQSYAKPSGAWPLASAPSSGGERPVFCCRIPPCLLKISFTIAISPVLRVGLLVSALQFSLARPVPTHSGA